MVLVAEDDRDQSERLCEALKDHGYAVHAAFNGPDTLQAACTLPPALILLDVQLPGLTGIQVLEKLRERTDTLRIPVIVVSAFSSWRVDARLRALNVKAELPKPFELADLLCLVREHLPEA